MNKYYVLNNSLDRRLYLESRTSDTRLIKESLKFATRKLAEKYLSSRNLGNNYHPKLIVESFRKKKLTESVSDADIVRDEIQSAIDDTLEMVDTCIDFINSYTDDSKINEEYFGGSNIEDILDRLKKVKTYMSGMVFRPSFDNSLCSDDIPSDKNPPNPSSSVTSSSDSGNSSK